MSTRERERRLVSIRRSVAPERRDDYDALTAQWGVTPALEKLLS